MRPFAVSAALLTALVPLAAPLAAQVSVRSEVDTTTATVGDRITLTVSVDHPVGSRVVWPDSVDMAPFEVLDARFGAAVPAGEGLRSTATLTLTAFELGALEIPSLDFDVSGPAEGVERVGTDRFGIEVQSVGTDEGGEIRDIRGPLVIPLSVVRVSLWVVAVLLLAGLALLTYRRWKRPSSGPEAPGAPAPARPPHEVALEALADLEASGLLERGQVKEYHVRASDIVRAYVEGRFGVRALEMTTRELLVGCEHAGVEAAVRGDLGRMLDACDMVKFAKVRPDAEASREALALGRGVIERTVPAPLSPVPSESHPEPEPVAAGGV